MRVRVCLCVCEYCVKEGDVQKKLWSEEWKKEKFRILVALNEL